MKKEAKLIIFGISPLFIGYILNFVIVYLPAPVFFLSIAFLVYWYYGSYKLADSDKGTILQIVMLCGFGLLDLLFLLYQEWVLGEYLGNIIAVGSQMYYLPMVSVSSSIILAFTNVGHFWSTYIVSWILMLVVSGMAVNKKRQK